MTLERKMVSPARPAPDFVAPPVAVAKPAARKSNLGWFIGAGAAALAAGGSAGVWAYYSHQVDKCGQPPSGFQPCSNKFNLQLWRDLGIGGTIAGGAAAITLAVIGIASRQPASDRVAFDGLRCVPTLSGVSCLRSF